MYSFYGNKLQCKIEASYFAGTSFARLYFPFRSTNHITLYSIRLRDYTTNSATQLWQRKKKGYVNVVIDVRSNSRHERIDLTVAPIVGNLKLWFTLGGVNTIVYIHTIKFIFLYHLYIHIEKIIHIKKLLFIIFYTIDNRQIYNIIQ